MKNEQLLAKINETMYQYMEGLITDTEAMSGILNYASQGFTMFGFHHVTDLGVKALWKELSKGSVHVLYELNNQTLVDVLMQKEGFNIREYVTTTYRVEDGTKEFDELYIETHEEIAGTVFALMHASYQGLNDITFDKHVIEGLMMID